MLFPSGSSGDFHLPINGRGALTVYPGDEIGLYTSIHRILAATPPPGSAPPPPPGWRILRNLPRPPPRCDILSPFFPSSTHFFAGRVTLTSRCSTWRQVLSDTWRCVKDQVFGPRLSGKAYALFFSLTPAFFPAIAGAERILFIRVRRLSAASCPFS